MNLLDEIQISKYNIFAMVLDIIVIPFMYLLSGTFKESPQKTLPWNNLKIKEDRSNLLSIENMVFSEGLPNEKPRWKFILPFFHLPILGGWKNYLVLLPADDEVTWHVGWITEEVSGVSLIYSSGPVRVLLGPNDVKFFGLDNNGRQIKIKEIGRGVIGKGGQYSKLPLF